MKLTRILLSLLLVAGIASAEAVGEKVWGTASGGGTGTPPATGVDTTLCLLENSDFDGNEVCTIIDATNNIPNDITHYIGPLGISGSRTLVTFVDDIGGRAQPEEYLKWGLSEPGADTGSLHRRSDNASVFNTNIGVGPIAGGRVVGQALGIRLALNNNGANDYCSVSVHRSTATGITPNLDPTTIGVATGWTECTGTIEVGALSSNSGGIGDAVLSAANERYLLPLSDCECTNDDCVLVVAVTDRNEGGSELCTDIDDWHVALFVGEVYP